MCWSFEVSLGAGIWSYLVVMLLLIRGKYRDRANAIFLASYTAMQFSDAILWFDEASAGLSTCSARNHVTTQYIIPLILFMEPLTSYFGVLFYKPKYFSLRYLVFVSVFSYATTFLITLLTWQKCSSLSASGALLWGSFDIAVLHRLAYALALIVGHYGVIGVVANFKWNDNEKDKMPSVIASIGWISFAIPAFFTAFATDAFGSHWCLYGVTQSIWYFVEPYVIQVFCGNADNRKKEG